MIQILHENNCCGCGACQVVCPVSCIHMVEGTLGAQLPRVDLQKCIKCGKCEKVCPMLHAEKEKNLAPQVAYAAYAENTAVRFAGSSGGLFGTLAKALVKECYLVYGAAFDEDLKLKCTSATNEAELVPLFKSKYLQSELAGRLAEIKQLLDSGSKVMFVSTPCQVTALKRFLGKPYVNLVLVDFLCHGTPSQRFFDECREYEEKKRGGEINTYSFRTKTKNGSTPHYVTLGLKKGNKQKNIVMPYFKSPYYAFFQRYITLRESCYDCIFSTPKRVSDITIADFHDIERYEPSINRFDGVSMVMCHTQRGKELFAAISDELWVREFALSELMGDGVLFGEKTKRPKVRDAFVQSYCEDNFEVFVKKNTSKKKQLIYGVYYKLPRFLRGVAKKICHIE